MVLQPQVFPWKNPKIFNSRFQFRKINWARRPNCHFCYNHRWFNKDKTKMGSKLHKWGQLNYQKPTNNSNDQRQQQQKLPLDPRHISSQGCLPNVPKKNDKEKSNKNLPNTTLEKRKLPPTKSKHAACTGSTEPFNTFIPHSSPGHHTSGKNKPPEEPEEQHLQHPKQPIPTAQHDQHGARYHKPKTEAPRTA